MKNKTRRTRQSAVNYLCRRPLKYEEAPEFEIELIKNVKGDFKCGG